MFRFLAAIVIAAFLATPAMAAGHHRHHHHYRHHAYHHTNLVTVKTAAGIAITVAADAADQFQGFIRDLVAMGYHPRDIGCYAPHGHIPGSLHHSGHACDFDQNGWDDTAGPMYHVRHLAEKWGLRDGCTFRHPRRDCGHIDTGFGGAHYAAAHYRRRVTADARALE